VGNGEELLCDNRGVTHLSLCHFHKAKCLDERRLLSSVDTSSNSTSPGSLISTLSISYKGACCLNNCTSGVGAQWDLVCDQHGNLYKNSCLFTLAQCEARRRKEGVEPALRQLPCSRRQLQMMLRKHTLEIHSELNANSTSLLPDS